MRRTIQHRHESCSTRRQMQPHALHQRVSRVLLLHGDERRAHRLLLAEPGGGALHHRRPQALLLQLQPGGRGVHGPAGRHAHPPHPHPRLPHAGHGGAGGLVQQTERHPGLASAGPGREERVRRDGVAREEMSAGLVMFSFRSSCVSAGAFIPRLVAIADADLRMPN